MHVLLVHVTPRASRNAITGFDPQGRLKVRVTASPTDGAANTAVTKLLAKTLNLPQRDITLVRGHTSREKHFEIPLASDELHHRLTSS